MEYLCVTCGNRWIWLLLAVGTAVAATGCAKKHDPREEVDGSVAPDGTVAGDAQATEPDGGETNEPCLPETGLPCDCDDGVTGYQYCTDDRAWGPCECPAYRRHLVSMKYGATLGSMGWGAWFTDVTTRCAARTASS